MKKTLTLVAASALTLMAGLAQAQETTIRWGTEPGYKPFTYKDADGNLTGFDVDIGEAICAELNAECVWVEQDWDGLIPALQARRFDGILASMSITEDRSRVVDFTRPYYVETSQFLGPIDKNYTDDESLNGKSVGVLRGSIQADFIAGARPELVVTEYPSNEEIYLDMIAGRIDIAFVGSIATELGFLASDDGKPFALFGEHYADPEYFGDGVGIAMRKSDAELRDKISQAILTIRENGTYAEINDRYFSFDIWGQ
ncbi:transporter substrate-binding domain-containing protein [Ruegeria sp.]|uniref:transporter substrate-binding domain-containing protein n=1 Tax=Ruegeria sp. TaxID=1879320 RepID=UPI00230CB83C|nr:transporter substrate-binding domain-containing protein [Ruegeria sp.]MDA7965339.1 transporter substrate-binding domain-containing protein [Ruegeria sp.]